MDTVSEKHEIRFYNGKRLLFVERVNEPHAAAKEYARIKVAWSMAHRKRAPKAVLPYGDRFEIELVRRVRKTVEYDRDAEIGSP